MLERWLEVQIAVEYVFLACLVILLSVSRWYYWRGRCEMLTELQDWEANALRKRLKANGRLLAGMESQLQQWQVWSRAVIAADRVDCEATNNEPENEPETPDDGG